MNSETSSEQSTEQQEEQRTEKWMRKICFFLKWGEMIIIASTCLVLTAKACYTVVIGA